MWLAVFLQLTSSLGAIAKKTKLCGDETCSGYTFFGFSESLVFYLRGEYDCLMWLGNLEI